MKPLATLALLLGAAAFSIAADDYKLGPDSQPQEGVPQGKVIGPLTMSS